MKKIPDSRWTPKENCWHIPYQKDAYAQLKRLFGEGQIIVLKKRPETRKKRNKHSGNIQYSSLNYKEELNRFEERLTIQRYSFNTIKTYKNFFAQYLAYYLLMVIYGAGLRIGESIQMLGPMVKQQNSDT